MNRRRVPLLLCCPLLAALVSGCSPGTNSIGELPTPLGNAHGQASARLLPLATGDEPQARDFIATLITRGRGPLTGYARDEFGAAWTDSAQGVLWAGNSCSTRDDVLARDLDEQLKRDQCVVVAGSGADPYTGSPLVFGKARASEYPIDHIVPLAYSWELGSAQWSEDKRVAFANDPLNLVLTSRSANSAKSSSGPASWLPANKPIRCAYVLRFAQVVDTYDLAVTAADKDVMAAQCAY